ERTEADLLEESTSWVITSEEKMSWSSVKHRFSWLTNESQLYKMKHVVEQQNDLVILWAQIKPTSKQVLPGYIASDESGFNKETI
ncbi:hypothetical protein L9F63_018256, partial [Diploptera punctata]